MNMKGAVLSSFTGSLHALLYEISKSNNIPSKEVLNSKYAYPIVEVLRENGARLLTMDDFNLIKRSLEDIDVSENVKIILNQFIDSIEDLMKGDKQNA